MERRRPRRRSTRRWTARSALCRVPSATGGLMRSRILLMALLAALTATAHAQFFPYPVQKRTLPNGLDVIVIETPEFRNVLSFNTLIMAGSGRENEKGRTGLRSEARRVGQAGG